MNHEQRQDYDWSNQWVPMLRCLIGPYLLGPSSFEDDTEHAADLVVLTAKDMKIGCRVRRRFCRDGQTVYAERFPNQFTIRSGRTNGCETELSKVLHGWGDWFFYGHDNGAGRIDPWWLINLTVFRATYAEKEQHPPGDLDVDWWEANQDIRNVDQKTLFRAYPIRLFPSTLLIGDSVRHRQWVQGFTAPKPPQRPTWTPIGPLVQQQKKLW